MTKLETHFIKEIAYIMSQGHDYKIVDKGIVYLVRNFEIRDKTTGEFFLSRDIKCRPL